MAGLDRIRVAVKSDEIVLRDPKSRQRVTTAGMVVDKNPFWLRRIKCGDCILMETVASNNKSEPIMNEGEHDGDSI